MKNLRSLTIFTGVTSSLLILTVLSGHTETIRSKFRIPVANSTQAKRSPTLGSGLKIADVHTVQPHLLAIRIESGQVSYGRQVPYLAQAGDQIETDESGNTWLYRPRSDNQELQAIGALVGPEQDILRFFDRFQAAPLNLKQASNLQIYRLSSREDHRYHSGQHPQRIYRKTKPTDQVQTGPWKMASPQDHTLYLEFTEALIPGQRYQLALGEYRVSFDYNPENQISEAVHVSHVGFRPQDPKVAFLSTWMGDGGGVEYSTDLTFWVVDYQTRQRVYQGQVELHRAVHEAEDPRDRNYNGTSVYRLPFDTMQRPGEYQVCVEGVGCSVPFAVDAKIWQAPFQLVARGFYHQRSGIELAPPYTEIHRPRSFHPDDGQPIYQSTASILDSGNGLDYDKDHFKALIEGKTPKKVDVWGGYFDAGDWDRRTQHLEVARLLLELVEIAPATASTNLNLPESNNALPDLIDEALWGLDFFRRLQLRSGGVRGGIESADHPRWGETSWQESLTVMAYEPDLWTSYVYAGVAARAARVLELWVETTGTSVNAEVRQEIKARSRLYRRSALAAMTYAEKAYAALADQDSKSFGAGSLGEPKSGPKSGQNGGDRQAIGVRDARNLAAVELLRLTGETSWHQIFAQTTAFTQANAQLQHWDSHNQRDAAFVYLQLPIEQTDAAIRQSAKQALLKEAEASIALSQRTGFGWTRMDPMQPVSWSGSFGNPKVTTLIRAHALTKDKRYLKTALQASQFGLGANPFNMTLTTGLGYRSPQNPLMTDQRVLGQPPLPGITVYGPFNWEDYPDSWHAQQIAAQVYPPLRLWPATEAFFDVYLFPSVTEFTVAETMAPVAYAWGYFAGQGVELE